MNFLACFRLGTRCGRVLFPLLLLLVVPSLAAAGGAGLRAVGPDGEPVPGAWLSCGGPAPRGRLVATADADGRFSPVACEPGEAAWVGAAGRVPRPVSGTTGEIRLERGETLAGRVTDGQGRPLAGVPVTVRDRLVARHVVTDGKGSFAVSGLAVGRATVRAGAPGRVTVEQDVLLPGGDGALSLAVPSPAPLLLLPPGAGRGRVRVGPAGDGPRYLLGDRPLLPLAEELPRERVPPGTPLPVGPFPAGVPLAVEVAWKGCAPVRLEARAGAEPLRVPCRTGRVTGRIALPPGVDLPDALRVCARPVNPDSDRLLARFGETACGPVDPRGTWTVGPLPPGRWRIVLGGGTDLWLPRSPEVVVGAAGETDAGVLRPRPGLPLAGRVTGEAGGVEGARVLAAPAGREGAWRAETRSGPGGTFRLAVPDRGPWTVRVESRGLPPREIRGVTAPRRDLSVDLRPAGRLAFTLVDAEGLPVPFTRVFLLAPSSGVLRERRRARGDDEGRFLLDGVRPGVHTVRIVAPGWSPLLVPRVEVSPGETADLGTLELGRGRLVGGLVTDPDGNAVPGACVSIVTGGVPEGGECDATTGEDGRFALPGVPRRAVSLLVTAPGLAPVTRDLPAAPPGGTDEGEVEIVLPRGGTIACRVERIDGTPVGDAEVHVAGFARLLRALSGPDGRALLEHVPPGQRTVRARLDPRDPLAGEVEARVEVPEGGEREVVLRPGTVVTGVVLRNGASVPFAEITAVRLPGGTEGTSTRADAEGRFRLALAEPGNWSFSVRTETCETHRELAVGEGDAEVALVVPPADLAGRVVEEGSGEPIPGTRVTWRRGAEGPRGTRMVGLPDGSLVPVPWEPGAGGSAVADAAGEWALCVPAGGGFRLEADAGDEYQAWSREAGETPPSPLEIRLRRRPAALRIRVTCTEGSCGGGKIGLVVRQASGYESIGYLPPGGVREMAMPEEPFRVWAVARGYGMAVTRWFDPARGEVPPEGIEVRVDRGGWLRLALDPGLAADAARKGLELHLYDDEGNDLYARAEQVGALSGRPGDAPGEVFLGVFPRGTFVLAWKVGERSGRRQVVVGDEPVLVVLGED